MQFQFFGFKTVNFGRTLWKKCPKRGRGGGVIANPKNFIANLRILSGFSGKKRNVISKKGRGGGVKAVWKFSKKTSIFEPTVVPKGSLSLQKRMNFRKSSKRPLTVDRL